MSDRDKAVVIAAIAASLQFTMENYGQFVDYLDGVISREFLGDILEELKLEIAKYVSEHTRDYQDIPVGWELPPGAAVL